MLQEWAQKRTLVHQAPLQNAVAAAAQLATLVSMSEAAASISGWAVCMSSRAVMVIDCHSGK